MQIKLSTLQTSRSILFRTRSHAGAVSGPWLHFTICLHPLQTQEGKEAIYSEAARPVQLKDTVKLMLMARVLLRSP